jgi:hypothetical protein
MPEERKDPKVLLEDAIRRRDELNTFIKVLQEMIGGVTASEDPADKSKVRTLDESVSITARATFDPATVVYPGMFFGKSQPQAAKLLLEHARRPLKTKLIVELLERGGCKVGGKKPSVNLWGVLKRNTDMFALVPKAGWGLVDWYEPSVLAKMQKEVPKEDEEGNGEEPK